MLEPIPITPKTRGSWNQQDDGPVQAAELRQLLGELHLEYEACQQTKPYPGSVVKAA